MSSNSHQVTGIFDSICDRVTSRLFELKCHFVNVVKKINKNIELPVLKAEELHIKYLSITVFFL